MVKCLRFVGLGWAVAVVPQTGRSLTCPFWVSASQNRIFSIQRCVLGYSWLYLGGGGAITQSGQGRSYLHSGAAAVKSSSVRSVNPKLKPTPRTGNPTSQTPKPNPGKGHLNQSHNMQSSNEATWTYIWGTWVISNYKFCKPLNLKPYTLDPKYLNNYPGVKQRVDPACQDSRVRLGLHIGA